MKVLGIILAVLLFIIMIIIHEAGHLFSAKLCGVRVEEFSVGMGPLIYKKQKAETQYSLRAIPIGGYCKLESEDGDSDSPSAFVNSKWWKKIIILAAGAFNNIVLCLIVLFFVYLYCGSYSPVLSAVSAGSPADIAGIKAGDKIVAVDGSYYKDWNSIVDAICVNKESVSISYLRDGAEYTTDLKTVFNEESGRYVVGIQCSVVHSPLVSIKESLQTSVSYFEELIKFFGRLFHGHAKSDDVVGVVGMVSMISEEAEKGLLDVFFIMALISLNIGAVNLLPFPALDGGRILFVILRLITRDKINSKIESYVNAAGLIILLALMVLLIFKDTINIILK